MLLYESEMMLNSQEMREESWSPKAGKARRKGHGQRTGEESPAALVSCLSCATGSLPETSEKEFLELSPWPFTSWQWGWIMGSSHLLPDRAENGADLGSGITTFKGAVLASALSSGPVSQNADTLQNSPVPWAYTFHT